MTERPKAALTTPIASPGSALRTGARAKTRRGAVLAIDGGNSKTDVVLVAADGAVLATARGPGFRPGSTGLPAAVDAMAATVAQVLQDGRPVVDHVSAYTANVDLPSEKDELHQIIAARGWGTSTAVGNDTLALLRAGATKGWGVAVVCGSGINCVGVGAAGNEAGFAALGRPTGDWGGGHGLGEEALWHAVRGEEGRGPGTELTGAVASHFGLDRAIDVGIAVHTGQISDQRLGELSPVLFEAAAGGDAVARSLVDRQADEIYAMARVVLTRLGLLDTPAEVVLGGGVLAARPPLLMAAIEERFQAGAPRTTRTVVSASPVLGAALLGLDRIGAPPEAHDRLRAAFAT